MNETTRINIRDDSVLIDTPILPLSFLGLSVSLSKNFNQVLLGLILDTSLRYLDDLIR